MSLCFKCLKFTKSNDIKIKREMDVNINLYSHCIDCGFTKSDDWWRRSEVKKKKTLVSRNAGDQKIIHLGALQFFKKSV